ncbi:concanavalin A-like lectin/glucanase domain-containing protein, partial [Lineolata rhizophorae]
ARADCECGYSVNSTTDARHAVFTNLHETDFLHISDLEDDIGWQRQEYNVTQEESRGPFGKAARVDNVLANPLLNEWDWAGDSVGGGDAGLQLWVRERTTDGMIEMGEIVAEPTDVRFGSFRVGMKVTGVPGTCGAFFWFRNDSQEIDMEFLSRQLNESSSPVNLVLQSPDSVAAGYDASDTPTFSLYPLDFRPDELFHEYRFDWLDGIVSFYADGVWLQDMTVATPDSPGYLVLNHWSNGDPGWSGGPPERDALLTVSYVKYYFNTTGDEGDQGDGCGGDADEVAEKVCRIPDQTVAPDPSGPDGNETARTYFFSMREDMTPGQKHYG